VKVREINLLDNQNNSASYCQQLMQSEVCAQSWDSIKNFLKFKIRKYGKSSSVRIGQNWAIIQ